MHIPSLLPNREVPSAARVPAYPCIEQDGYIWVWPDAHSAPPGPPAAISEFAKARWRQGTVIMAAAAARVLENNLDWCHPAFAHPWTHGQFFAQRFHGAREQAYEVRLTERGLTVFAPPTVNATSAPPARPIVELAFTIPDRIRVEFWWPFHLLIYMHAVPTGAHSCRLEWLMPRLLPLGRHVSLTGRIPAVLDQDRRILESAERAYWGAGPGFERSVPADTSTLLLRLLLRHAARGTWADTLSKLNRRRVVKIRA